MRKWLAGLFFLLVGAIPALAEDLKLEPWQEKAIKLVKKEKKIIDARWSMAGILWVSMKDDGSRRDGYAEYLCMVLNNAGKPKGRIIVISIFDHAAMQRGDLRKIGRAGCM